MLTSSQVSLLRKQAESGNLSMKCRERLGWILHFVEHGCSVGDTCKAFDISRSTFHRWLDRFDPNDLSSLEEKSHEPLNVRQSQVAPEIVEHIRKYRQDSPLMGKERIAELLERDHGVMLSGSTIGRVIDRECLYFADTPLHWKKRMGTMAQQTAATIVDAPMQIALPQEQQGKDHCLWCKVASGHGHRIRKSLIIASIVTNAAVVALFALSALYETAAVQDQPNIKASVTEVTSFDLSAPSE